MIFGLDTGSCWKLEAADPLAASLVGQLSAVLGAAPGDDAPAGRALVRFRVSTAGGGLQVSNESSGELCSFTPGNFAAAQCWSGYAGEDRLLHLIGVSLVLAAKLQADGGVLLHGALAERDGAAALLLGPSGRGKTTASRMLAPPWRSLSDDLALLKPFAPGRWRAHPWPTWSALRGGAAGRSWDIRRGFDAQGIFFLKRGPDGVAERIGSGRAACLLSESFEQAWWAGSALFCRETLSGMRRQAFANISRLARDVPAFLLPLSPAGHFWERIEEALGEACCVR